MTGPPKRLPWRAGFGPFLAALIALPLGACASAPERPVLVASPGQTMEHLDAGRSLFSSHCQSCHALPEPAQLAPGAWPSEVSGMGRKSGLSAPQIALVSDYLVAASRAVHQQPVQLTLRSD